MLHPKYKLDYFRKNKWEIEWIDTVHGIARSHYDTYYKVPLPTGTVTGTVASTTVCTLSYRKTDTDTSI